MLSRDEEYLLIALLIKKRRRRRRRTFHVHPMLTTREDKSLYYTLFDDLFADKNTFFNYFRMSKVSFDELLGCVKPEITKRDTKLRRCIPPEEKLVITLNIEAMGQISEGSIDAQNIAKNLIEVIFGEVVKTLNERTEPHFDSFESLKLQSFGNEEILVCVKSEGMSLDEMKMKENPDQASLNDICYQNLSEVCVHSSTLSTLGEGDFQPPFVRETKAFYHLGSEGGSGHDQTYIDSSHSSVNTSFTDELIAQLHADINNISFDNNIHLSDSEVEKELQTMESSMEELQTNEETKIQVNQCCQTNSSNNFEEDIDSTNDQNNHELRHSPKFSHINDLLNKYFRLKENGDERENEEERELLSTSSEECPCLKSKREGCMDNFSQTNPFRNPFLCSNVNSTIALSSNCCESRDPVDESSGSPVFTDVGENLDNNEWVEANEVQIKITEPGCSKDFLEKESLDNDDSAVQTRQYWSNVGLITEHTVDRRYMGPVEIPGIESIKGVPRVQEKYLSCEPEKIIWVTEAEATEEKTFPSSSQDHIKDEEVNYLSLPEKTEERKKKKKFVSRLSKAISSIFKFNNKDSKE